MGILTTAAKNAALDAPEVGVAEDDGAIVLVIPDPPGAATEASPPSPPESQESDHADPA